MTQHTVNAGVVPYTMLWGTQFAMTTAFVVTMAGLWFWLRQPVMRSLAMHWLARLVVVAVNLLYFLSDDPRQGSLVAVAALFGSACGALFVTGRDIAALATREGRETQVWVNGGAVIGVFTLIAVAAHLLNIRGAAFSPAFAAIWTRSLYGAAYLCFLAWLTLRWLDHPTARHRLTPLIAGVALSIGFDGFDALQRALVLSGGRPYGGAVAPVISLLIGTLCLGLGSLLSALESERDTLRAQAEQLRTAQREQGEALRLQSLGRLAGGVAHDFNNVLGLIVNGIDLVDDALRDEQSEARQDLLEMRVAADRGAALTRRLLSFSRPQAVAPERFSPASVIRETLPMLQRLLSSRVSLKAHVTGSAQVHMERAQFEQLVINLLVNARDATTGNGTIRLHLDEEGVVEERHASVGTVLEGRWVRLSVIDEGTGIGPDVLPNLFEPFFTTKGDMGTGLGLATVAATVRDVHGAVDVFSTPGRGTRFDVWLPVATGQLASNPSGERLQETM
jgi:signal transduction histidine kinase